VQRKPKGRARAVGRLALTVVLVVLIVLVMAILAVAAVVGVALLAPMPPLFVGAGIGMAALGGLLAGWVVGRRQVPATRGRITAVGGLLGALAAAWLLLFPMTDPRIPAEPVDGMQRVTLSNGDDLYVRLLPSAGAASPDSAPIVFVHGGPGVADMRHDAEAFANLTDMGHELVLYDEIGAGHSGRLDDPSLYSLDRDVADLEELVGALGLERPIFIGHSYGAQIVAGYLSRHPDAATSLVFSAPGEIRPYAVDYHGGMRGRLDSGQTLELYANLMQPRALVGWLLSQTSPVAAHAYAADAEMDARFDRLYAMTEPGLFCDTSEADATPDPHALGFYTNARVRVIPDLRPMLAQVTVPALIIKPQCDYLPWSFGTDLAHALPDARLVYLRGAGHSTYIERRDAFFGEVRAFIRGEPLPIAPQTDDRPPDDLRSPIGEQ
jgi:proline iminopeptidase